MAWQASTVGSVVSIAFFNFFGLSVTKSLSGAARAAIDACRTILIWLFSVQIGWESFHGLQVCPHTSHHCFTHHLRLTHSHTLQLVLCSSLQCQVNGPAPWVASLCLGLHSTWRQVTAMLCSMAASLVTACICSGLMRCHSSYARNSNLTGLDGREGTLHKPCRWLTSSRLSSWRSL